MARTLAVKLASALTAVPAFGTVQARTAALRAAACAAHALTSALPATGTVTAAESLPAKSAVQSYFRVRTAELGAGQAAHQAAGVIHRGLVDLCDAPLAGSDIARETAAMRQVALDLLGQETFPEEATNAAAEPGTGPGEDPVDGIRRPEDMWLARWITGHHIHVLFNVYATFALREAVRRLREGQWPQSTALLHRATVYVQGFPAARAHASALPADHYATAVRPTMVPTVVPVPLSGAMHVEYRAYRDAVGELIAALPEPVETLALRAPELAFAREALLESDLVEAERHVCLVEPVVGSARSLVQPPATTDNAVSVLRAMRHQRAVAIAPYVRFKDSLASAFLTREPSDTP
ncbi:hypothetical protein I5Q34_08230 [Streptomyces sp. AV19]|uniref:hypothetical protein n=1 Tax=Streptomyces sp. AV19 TaxID=2793068 RepID=UPI0018FE18AE|nr:hypothetical protein [Streptomyces sp. AV19]MBH1934282.1 hypothetical protein [Streptomyces sp. AV19]MDG4533408.1 hypothetical protein [Streptomyces sp. AV19]